LLRLKCAQYVRYDLYRKKIKRKKIKRKKINRHLQGTAAKESCKRKLQNRAVEKDLQKRVANVKRELRM